CGRSGATCFAPHHQQWESLQSGTQKSPFPTGNRRGKCICQSSRRAVDMARVKLEGVRKIYTEGAQQVAVDRVDLDVKDGEFVVLVGPSGCGKSTTLRMIAGLESISAGTVRIGERVVNDVPPKTRDIAMVFQNYALYPHMTVRENLGFALKLKNMPSAEIDKRVNAAAATLGL